MANRNWRRWMAAGALSAAGMVVPAFAQSNNIPDRNESGGTTATIPEHPTDVQMGTGGSGTAGTSGSSTSTTDYTVKHDTTVIDKSSSGDRDDSSPLKLSKKKKAKDAGFDFSDEQGVGGSGKQGMDQTGQDLDRNLDKSDFKKGTQDDVNGTPSLDKPGKADDKSTTPPVNQNP